MAFTLPQTATDCCNRCPEGSGTTVVINGDTLVVDTIAALQALPGSDDYSLAYTRGGTVKYDGFGHAYMWDPTGTEADDGAAIIRPSDFDGAGLWRQWL
jgi:hypothetical protein